MSKIERNIDFEKKLLNAAAQYQANHQTSFSRDRSLSLGASEVGRCLRASRYAKDKLLIEGTQPPAPNPRGGYMMRGKVMEDYYIVPMLREMFPDTVSGLGDEQETQVHPECEYLTATSDGTFIDEDGTECLLEFKTFDPRAIMDKPKNEHVFQTHAQMAVLGVETYTLLIYVNSSDWFDFRVFKIEYDPHYAAKSVERAETVMTCEDVTKLPKHGKLSGTCRYCDYKEQCEADRPLAEADILEQRKRDKNIAVKAKKSTISSNKADTVAKKYIAAKKKMDALKQEMAELSEELATVMSSDSRDSVIHTEGYSLELVTSAPRKLLNKNSLEEFLEEHGKTVEDFKEEKGGGKPRIKLSTNRKQ